MRNPNICTLFVKALPKKERIIWKYEGKNVNLQHKIE
jgi:hypothetical protein